MACTNEVLVTTQQVRGAASHAWPPISCARLPCICRQLRVARPNVLWVSDCTCVATSSRSDAPHRRTGFVDVALDIDAFARDALEQALHVNRPATMPHIGVQC